MLAGDPGVGKTTLWQAGVQHAEQNAFRVLWTRASDGEAALLFAGLADLTDGLDQTVMDRIPSPQARALEVALRRVDPGDSPPEPFAISSGFLNAVRIVATENPVLIAVDDAQWLDPSSLDCLLFLARRLKGYDIRFLLTRRGERQPTDLERALEPHRVQRLQVGGLSMGAVSRLVSERLDQTVPRRVLRQLYETSHGNCLFALELVHLLREGGVPAAGFDLPVPKMVEDVFAARVEALETPVRLGLLAVALSSGLTQPELASVVDPLAVEEAVEVGLLVLDRGRLRPAHPMYAASVLSGSTAAERHDLHLALAAVVSDEVLSARHAAMATVTTDARVADTVSAAARLALERGAFSEAESLAAHALRLTPSEAPERAERLLELVESHLRAADYPAADAALRDQILSLAPGRQRARGHFLLAQGTNGGMELAQLDLAMAEAPDDAAIIAMAMTRKAVAMAISVVERLPEAEDLARRARPYAIASGEESRVPPALAWTLVMQGKSPDEVGELTSGPLSRNLYETSVDRAAGVRMAFRGELDAANGVLRELMLMAGERADDAAGLAFSIQLGEFALRAGDVIRAGEFLDELDQWTNVPMFRTIRARLQALRAAMCGQTDSSRRWAGLVLDGPETAHADVWDQLEAERALGLVALLEGDVAGAVDAFDHVWQHCVRQGVDDPGAFPVAGDLVEVLVDSDRLAAAQDVASRLARLSREQDHPWGLATTKRAQAMIAAGPGPTDRALGDLLAAAAGYGRLGLYFEQARCLSYASRLQRQSKKRAAARQALTGASEIFERLGCIGWAAKTRSELRRISGRKPADQTELTPSEERIVELAASGLSNKEIARTLVVSVYTVQTHLSRAYAKLGVTSRNQLAGRLGPD